MDDPSPPLTYDPPPIGPRRLTRSSTDQMVAGVCGGVAAYLGVDATLVRIGVVLLSLAGGLGVIAYALAWVLLPDDGEITPPKRSPWQLGAVAVGVVLLAATVDGWNGGGATVSLALLAVGAVLVWGGRDPAASLARAAGEERDRPVPARAADEPTAVVEHAGPGRWTWAPATPAAAPPRPRPDRSGLARAIAVGLGGILLAMGAITGAVAASAEVAPTVVLGLCLAGFGAVMVAGSWWGWSRPLAFGGMGVVLALALVAVIDVPITGGTSDRTVRPLSVAEIPRVERLAAGQLTLDLSELALTGDERHVEASVALGELVVEVPEGVTVEVRAEAGLGQVDVFEVTEDGASATVDDVFDGSGPGRIQLDLEVGIGHVEVRRG